MRIIMSLSGQDFLLPEGINIDEVIKIAEDSMPVKRGYGDKDWRESVNTSACIEIKLVGNNTVPQPNKEEVPL